MGFCNLKVINSLSNLLKFSSTRWIGFEGTMSNIDLLSLIWLCFNVSRFHF